MEAKGKFSKGPWYAVFGDEPGQIGQTIAPHKRVAEVDHNNPDWAANAALMAAAPDLYEALKWCSEGDACACVSINLGTCGHCRARAALRKAESHG